MAPLVQNMPWKDAQLSKFGHNYMWNKTYYLQRTKFAVYQLSTTIIGVGHALCDVTLKHYRRLPGDDIPGFPDAHFRVTDIITILALNIAACSIVGIVFSAALFFDLFWPERIEARSIQWAWKLSAAFASVFLLAGSLSGTFVIAWHEAGIRGTSLAEESAIRESWSGTPLVYRQYNLSVPMVALCWVGWIFTSCSALVMWQCYAHNNKHGPFSDRNAIARDTTPISEVNRTDTHNLSSV